jgi:hypothetical protein
MELKKGLKKFSAVFMHPRVIIYVLLGTAIIFLTFLTDNNALEIAISGVASVFIGIGVNNYTSVETHIKDEQKLKKKIDNAVKILRLIDSRIHQNIIHMSNGYDGLVKKEMEELQKFLKVSIELVEEDTDLN